MTRATLYFHAPCFDGLVSAALACEITRAGLNWEDPRLVPVTYSIRSDWLEHGLAQPAGAVDFLYHPSLTFFADHHSTSFASKELRDDFSRRSSQWLSYDADYPSCAELLFDRYRDRLPRKEHDHYKEAVSWATIIDGAKYSGPEEAVRLPGPAGLIRDSLVVDASEKYCVGLVHRLRRASLADVSRTEEVRERANQAHVMSEIGRRRFQETATYGNGLVRFSVNVDGAIVNRYLPFLLFPHASYSLGLIWHSDPKRTSKVTAMRNPWMPPPRRDIGGLFKEFGGGGHQRIGSVILRKSGPVSPEFVMSLVERELQADHAQDVQK